MRYAYFGRTSTDDAQDPSLSIPRQLTSCEGIVQPLGDEIVAHYWDIESGRKNLAERGNGADGSAFNITVPRDGGITDLLKDAAKGRFGAVIVESIDRLSRMTADSTRVEQELERLGVGLFAADEPMTTNATSILTRRVKQGVAERYVRDLLEKSRRGMEESVRQGWHTGGPAPYGYTLEPHPHPNPHKGTRRHEEAPSHPRTDTHHGRADDLRGLLRTPPRDGRDLRQAQPRPRPPPATGAQPQGRERAAPDLEQVADTGDVAQPEVHRLQRLEPPRQAQGTSPDPA